MEMISIQIQSYDVRILEQIQVLLVSNPLKNFAIFPAIPENYGIREGEEERETTGGCSGASNEQLTRRPYTFGFASPWCT